MGVGGWDLLADNVTLVGTVVDHAYSGNWFEGDDDWSITIKPLPGFEWVAKSNDGGTVECEIRTPIDDESSQNVQFGELMGRVVTAVGCWCTDVSHNHKTELHPLQLLIWDSGPVNGQSKRVKVMVFSDHSPSFMIIPPRPSPLDRDRSTHAIFDLTFPLAPHDDTPPVLSIANQNNMTDSCTFSVVGGNGAFQLHADIASGHGDGKGYYRGHLDLTYNTSREPSYIGLARLGTDEHWGAYAWSPADFFSMLKNRFAENIPATKLRTYVINGQRVWSGEFDRNGRQAHCQWYMTWDEFLAAYDELWPSWNLVDLETHVDDGQRFWTALWYAKTTSDGIAWGSLQDVLHASQKWNAPPVTLKTFVEGGIRHWIGVFRQTGVPTAVRQDLDWPEVLALHADPAQAIVHLEPYLDNGRRHWAAIVELRANDVALTLWSNKNLYRDEVQRLFDTYGLRVADFAVCRGWE
ncbi:MAG: hypothetical protein NVSMB2_08650 [Chloroflexota bacterium]